MVARHRSWRAGLAVMGLAATLAKAAAPFSQGLSPPPPTAELRSSAGVFSADGRLLRTLWSARPAATQTLPALWDGCDDLGEPVDDPGPWRLRVLTHRVKAVWEGVIGNTSRPGPGQQPHRAFGVIEGMAIDAMGIGYYVVGYNEQQHGLHRFDTARPQGQWPLGRDDYRRVFRHLATDGERVYIANAGLPAPPGNFARDAATFVTAVDAKGGDAYLFPAGTDLDSPHPGNRWPGVIDLATTDPGTQLSTFPSAATGIAVQRHGNLLFVAHGPQDEIRIYDKLSGRLLDRWAVSQPGSLAVAPDDSLWLLAGVAGTTELQHWQVVDRHWQAVTRIASGALRAVALAVSPRDGRLVVVDAGRNQLQVHDLRGRLERRLGVAAAFRDAVPTVTHDRYWLDAGPTYVAFQPDGSLWLGDPGNVRNLRMDLDGRPLDTLQYLPRTYRVAVDTGDTGRVFAGFLEFEVDADRPLAEAWRLVANWAAGLPLTYLHDFEGFLQVITLPDGGRYGLAADSAGGRQLLQLDTLNGARPTGAFLPVDAWLAPDGSWHQPRRLLDGLEILVRPYRGVDASGRPQWGPSSTVAGTLLRPADPAPRDVPRIAGINDPRMPRTGDGLYVVYDAGKAPGFHLGALKPRHEGWWWRALPAGSWQLDVAGVPEDVDGRYETGRGVHYPGSVVMAEGEHIIAGYHGEAWNSGQANQWFHFHASGLFIGQFGQPVYPARNRLASQPGAAGNAFSPALVRQDGALHLWHNDESVHGGIHRWHLDGLDSVHLADHPLRRASRCTVSR